MSTLITMTPQTWIQITNVSKDGAVRHQSGNGKIVYTESVAQPVGYDGDTAVSGTTDLGDEFVYFNMPATKFLWGYAVDVECKVTATESGDGGL